MREVKQRTDGPDGALSACVLSLLELGWDGTPGDAPLPRWQEWLAERNLRLVETAQLPPSGFWIAAVERDGAPHHVVMFGAPPDLVHDPAGGLPLGEPRSAFVLVPLDPALRAGQLPASADVSGTVEGLFVAAAAEAPCVAVESAEAIAGRGLRGDRYFEGQGTFGGPGAAGHQITLIEQEALDELAAQSGIELASADARRNVVTRGVDLNALTGHHFLIGDVEIVGRRWCEPCAHLQRLTTPGVLRGLVHRGGLRADIVRGGTIARGDRVRPVPGDQSG